MVSAPLLNIIRDVIRAAWCSFVFPGGFKEQQPGPLSSSSPGGKDWNNPLNSSRCLPPAQDFDICCSCLGFQRPPGPLGPWRGHCTSCRTCPGALPLCSCLLRSRMFSAHKSSRWKDSFGQRGGAGRAAPAAPATEAAHPAQETNGASLGNPNSSLARPSSLPRLQTPRWDWNKPTHPYPAQSACLGRLVSSRIWPES